MRRTLPLLLIFFLIAGLRSQTQVSGVIDTEVWNKAGSPYQVVGDINVLGLTIEPGVTVEFTGNYLFEVSGNLTARGSADDSIIFKAEANNTTGWKGLYFNEASSQCALSYVRISDASQNYALKISNCSLDFSQIAVKNNATTAILVDNGSLQLTHCFVQNNRNYGLEVINDGDVTLIACTITHNQDSGLHTEQGKIILKNSIVAHNRNEGILLSAVDDQLDATNTVIAFNGKEGIVGVQDDVTLSNSILYFNNALNQIANISGTTTVTFCDVQDQDFGSTNLMVDPQFEDTTTVFNLSAHSPAVDSGDPSDEVNDLYFPPSLGSVRNDMGAYGGPLARKWYRPLFVVPDTLNFGDVSVGDSLKSTVLLKNYGDQSLTVNALNLSGDDAEQFSLGQVSLPATIPMADSLRVPVTFHPASARLVSFNAQMNITSDIENRHVALSGRGVVADILALPTTLKFNDTEVGATDSLKVKIYNLGTDTLRIDSLQLLSPAFRARLSAHTLAPQSDAYLTLSVYFVPDTISDYQSTLKIFSNDPDESPLDISVLGTGLAPYLSFTPLRVNFDSVRVMHDSTFMLTLSNSGNATLSVDTLQLLHASAVFTIDEQPPVQLAAGTNEQPLHIHFLADTAGTFSDTLRLVSNDPFRPVRLIPLSATAIAPYLSLSRAQFDFGTVIAPKDSVLTVKIRNSGNVALHVYRFGLSGTDTASFNWWKGSEDLIIEPQNDSLTVYLQCAPQRSGFLQAQFNIISDDPRFDSLQVPVNAQIKASEMILMPDSLRFPPTILFDDVSQTVKIVNRGDNDLRIDSIKISQLNGNDLHFPALQFPQKIRPQIDTLNFTLRFNPQTVGLQNAQVQFFSNDPFVNPRVLKIEAQGVAPVLSALPDTIDFGAVSFYRIPVQKATLYSKGSAPAVISAITIVNDADQVFRLPSFTLPLTLTVSDSMKIPVTFTPHGAGTFSARLKIVWNDPFKKDILIPLKAKADSAHLQTPLNLFFGKQAIHSVNKKDLKIQNSSKVQITIDSVRISGRDSAQFQLDLADFDFSIQPGDTVLHLPVEYVPHSIGLHFAQVKIYSFDIRQKMLAVNLEGIALASANAPLLFSNLQDSVDFGTAFIDQSKQIPCYLMNLGNAVLRIDSLQLSGPNAADFALINSPKGAQIAADDTLKTFQLQFMPTAAGKRSANLRIYCNDGNPPMTLSLLGQGQIDTTPATVLPNFDTLQTIAGQSFTVSLQTFDDNTAIRQAEVYFKKGGETAFTKMALKKTAERFWQATIDSNQITMRGLALYFKVYHGGAVTVYPENGAQQPMAVNVHVPQTELPYRMLPEKYRMISLPLNTGQQTLKDLFGDELGSYDPARFRFFDWDAEKKAFTELRDMKETLPAGKAYYLITADTTYLSIQNAASVSAVQPFKLHLSAGWNMIGDPFAFPVDWKTVSGQNNLTLFYFNGSAWEMATVLEPFKGYAVKAPQAMTLQVPPVAATNSIAKPIAGGTSGEGWQLRLTARSGVYCDDINFAGVRSNARQTPDVTDIPEPPVIGKYVSLYFMPPGANHEKLTGDFRPPNQDGYQFDFTVKANTGQPLQLSVQADSLPADFEWCLVSPQNGVRYDELPVRLYTSGQTFRLLIGKKSFVNAQLAAFRNLPDRFRLHPNYPNPFNNSTVIQVDLPTADRLSVMIYDINGRRIRIIANHRLFDAGYYKFKWDGTNTNGLPVASGVYFIHLQGQKYRSDQKIILQK